MKRLILLRHAKSERDSESGRDFDRSLNDRGRADSRRIGEEIRALGLRFDLVLASPARRVVETLGGIGCLSPRYDERIYDASTGDLLEIVRGADETADRLMLVGHNPGFERLAALITNNQVADFPAAALAEIELPIDRWSEVDPGGGRLVRFIRPKELA